MMRSTLGRSWLLGSVLTGALALTLAGCSGDNGSAAEDEDSGSAASAAPTVSTSEGASGDKGQSPSTPGPKPGKDGGDALPDDEVVPSAPGTKPSDGRQDGVLDTLPGRTREGCVDVAGGRDVRSGGIAAGPFDEVLDAWSVDGELTEQHAMIYFIPLHAEKLGELAVTATRGSEQATVVRNSVSEAEQWSYFDTEILFPSPGQWTIRAQSGQDRGCWILDLR